MKDEMDGNWKILTVERGCRWYSVSNISKTGITLGHFFFAIGRYNTFKSKMYGISHEVLVFFSESFNLLCQDRIEQKSIVIHDLRMKIISYLQTVIGLRCH